MSTKRVCYYTVVSRDANEMLVRYGFARRSDCQIEVAGERWEVIAARLRREGYRLEECGAEADGSASDEAEDEAGGA